MTPEALSRAQRIMSQKSTLDMHIHEMEQFTCCHGYKTQDDPLGNYSLLPGEMIIEFREKAIAFLKAEREKLQAEMEAL